MLEERLNNDLKDAMKAKDALRLSCIRMVMADIKNAHIAKQKELVDDDIIDILQRQVKQHHDSIDGFKKGNRPELAKKEEEELKIIRGYLPQQLSEGQVAEIIKQAMEESGITQKKEMGKLMAFIMPKVKGRADGKLVSRIVGESLK
ncbi:MAG: GatB/YqeY domain-containing protein [Candidatus Omnitrophica bacterium]|nr:GatB/YqeY domain-containing protein [Candidatus Omnitrophota bacterium]